MGERPSGENRIGMLDCGMELASVPLWRMAPICGRSRPIVAGLPFPRVRPQRRGASLPRKPRRCDRALPHSHGLTSIRIHSDRKDEFGAGDTSNASWSSGKPLLCDRLKTRPRDDQGGAAQANRGFLPRLAGLQTASTSREMSRRTVRRRSRWSGMASYRSSSPKSTTQTRTSGPGRHGEPSRNRSSPLGNWTARSTACACTPRRWP